MAGSKTILFVEDDRPISEMYARLLIKAGFEVDFAYDGLEALAKSATKSYDLILLDIMMPGKSGIEVLHELRKNPGFNATRIIILTNLAQDKTSQEAIRSQADGYLVKADIIPSQLMAVVKEILS
ncbi:response regulator [Candidatus Saccharibacteria bacterium]|nr:response regulator [Candidatus Saccharibacteria bacterium]